MADEGKNAEDVHLNNAEENAAVNELNISFNDDSSPLKSFEESKELSCEQNSNQEFDDQEFSSDLFNVEDEFNVEDAIEEDEVNDDQHSEAANEIHVSEDLNWEDFEVVDEDEENNESFKVDEENRIETTECELQQISDDEGGMETGDKSLSLDFNDVNGGQSSLSQISPTPIVDTQLLTFSSIEMDNKLILDDNFVDKLESKSMEVGETCNEEEEIKPFESVSQQEIQPSVSYGNDLKIISSSSSSSDTKPKASNSSHHDLNEETELDSDVLEITVSRGEDLEGGESEQYFKQPQEISDAKIEEISKPDVVARSKEDDDCVILEDDSKMDPGKRTEPIECVALFVDSLAQLTFDWKKYTCFYCNPCQIFVTSTSAWEDHLLDANHKKNNFRWKCLHDLLQSGEVVDDVSKHQQDIDKCQEFIAGADYVIEIYGDNGQPRHWVCQLCNSVLNSFDFLVNHLTTFGHIDNYMEKLDPDLYTPPGRWNHEKLSDNVRIVTDSVERHLMNEARQFVKRKGRGKLKCYKGHMYRNSWAELDETSMDMEEQILFQEMQRFFSEGQIYVVESTLKSSTQSVANLEYRKMDPKTRDMFIGLQYLLEIWTPSRRVIPVWYCILCDSLVTNWSKHCEVVQHIAAYLKKHYKKYAFDCAVLEANDEEELRNNIIIAKTKVLQLEGYNCRVNYVVQVTKLEGYDSFVAINAIIAKQLVDKYKITIGDPPRQKRLSVTTSKEPSQRQSTVAAKSSENSKSSMKDEKKIVMSHKPERVSVKDSAHSRRTNGNSTYSRTHSREGDRHRDSLRYPVKSRPIEKHSVRKRSPSPSMKKSADKAVEKKKTPPTKQETKTVDVSQKNSSKPVEFTKVRDAEKVQAAAATTVALQTEKVKPTASTSTTATTTGNSQQKIPPVAKPVLKTSEKVLPAKPAAMKISSETAEMKSKAVPQKQAEIVVSTKKPIVASFRNVETKRRDSDRSPRRHSPPPKYATHRKRSLTPRKRSVSPRSKRHVRESDSLRHRRHEHEYHHRREEYRREKQRPPSPPRRRIVEEPQLMRRRSFDSPHRRRERSRSGGNRERYSRKQNEDVDFRAGESKYVAIYGAERQSHEIINRQQNESVVILSNEDLARFTDLLHLVGVDLGRQINMGDLDGLREKMGAFIFDRCLATILNPVTPLQAPPPREEMFVHQQQQQRRVEMVHQEPPPMRRTTRENQDYYRRRSQSPTRKMSSREISNRNSSQQQQNIVDQQINPTVQRSQASIINYFNGRNVPISSTTVGGQQQSVQNLMSNFLTTPPLFNSMGPPPPQAIYEAPITSYGSNEQNSGAIWNQMPNVSGRW